MVLRTSHTNHRTAWSGFFFALLGLLWCGYVAFPSANVEPCITSGCAITRSLSLGGISLWWVGGAYFFIQAIFCLRGSWHAGWRLAQLALFLDILLLLLMFVTGPCLDCLVVATLVAATAYCLRPAPHALLMGDHPKQLVLLPVWLGLFLGNAVLTANELGPRWIIGPTPTSQVRIYFSPSCPSCRDALVAFGNAALFPVFEKEGDLDAVLRLEQLLAEKAPMAEALKRATAKDAPAPNISTLTRVLRTAALLKNRATVASQGFSALPLIEINGMPKAWVKGQPGEPTTRPATPPTAPTHEGYGNSNFHSTESGQPVSPEPARGRQNPVAPNPSGEVPWEEGGMGQCGGQSATPCP